MSARASTFAPEKPNAFSLIEVLVIIAVMAVLVAIYLPNRNRQSRLSKRGQCTNNLKQIGLAFRIWTQPSGDRYPMRVDVKEGGAKELIETGNVYFAFLVMSNELSTPTILTCPADLRRTNALSWRSLGNQNINYFVGLDADESNPQMLLSGDDNLSVAGVALASGVTSVWTNSALGWTSARHKHAGNIGLADGSVHQASSSRLQHLALSTGVATNRLVLP